MPLDFCGYISQLDDEKFLDDSAYFLHRTIELSKLIAILWTYSHIV